MDEIKGNFRNKFYHTIDEKGRVSLPARYREIISTSYDDQLIITNYDSCLLAYPYDAWVTLEEKYNQLSIMQPEVEIFGQFFIAGASECTVDKLGRILIPPNLREYANLKKSVVFVGMGSRIQIWDQQLWEEKFLAAKEQFREIKGREFLAKLGF
ncbi:MAG: cell division protein [Deltaproteobacteria bacterium]|jgi:MraZ protein|nr:cell division protein [Deltaproteobacteria bacterium]